MRIRPPSSYYGRRRPGRLVFILAGASLFSAALQSQAPDLSPDQLTRNIAAKRFTGKPITLRVTGDDLRSAVEEIKKISGLPIDLDPAADDFIRRTASDKDVILANQMPWDALLNAILEEYRLGLSIEGGRLAVRSAAGDVRRIENPKPAGRPSIWIWLLPAALLLAAGTGALLFVRKKAARKKTPARFALEAESAEEIKKKILYLFEVEKIHRDEDLSLRTLADRLSVPAHHLSWVVNEVLELTFSSLVGQYRLNEIKKRLSDSRDAGKTILEIAFESGFNTKAAFNKAFKKQTGMTPSEFRQKNTD